MGLIKEFREFAVKGNVIDLAVGIIIGAAFGKIVSSLVNDVIMPPIGLALGNVDFKDLFVVLNEGTKAPPPYQTLAIAKEAGAATLNYGLFVNTVIEFLIVAFAVFILVKGINNMRRRLERDRETPAAAPPAPTRQEAILTEIRDLLAARR